MCGETDPYVEGAFTLGGLTERKDITRSLESRDTSRGAH